MILYNEGNPGRTNALFIEAPPDYPIPAVLASYEVGQALLDHAEPDGADRRRRDDHPALLRQRDRREPQAATTAGR